MARIDIHISFRNDQRTKVDKLLEEGIISKVCQDAVDAYFEVPQGKEEIIKLKAEQELTINQAKAKIDFLEVQLQKIAESEAQEAKRKEREEANTESRKKRDAEIKKIQEEQLKREVEERAAKERKFMCILDLVKQTTDFPAHFAKTFTKKYIEVSEPAGSKLIDVLLKTANENKRCFDRDKFLELTQDNLSDQLLKEAPSPQ